MCVPLMEKWRGVVRRRRRPELEDSSPGALVGSAGGSSGASNGSVSSAWLVGTSGYSTVVDKPESVEIASYQL